MKEGILMSKHKITRNERFSPLAIKLNEIKTLKQAINNSHMPESTKKRMMNELDCEWNKAWRNHYDDMPGYEITSPSPERDIIRAMKRFGMHRIFIDKDEKTGKATEIYGQDDNVYIMITAPHDNIGQWHFQATHVATHEKIEKFAALSRYFSHRSDIIKYLDENKNEILVEVMASLSNKFIDLKNAFLTATNVVETKSCDDQNFPDEKPIDGIRVYARTVNNCDQYIDMSLKAVYNLINNYRNEGYDVTAADVDRIISWLPAVKCIEVYVFAVNSYTKLIFEDDAEIEFINTGLEAMLSDHVKENGKSVGD